VKGPSKAFCAPMMTLMIIAKAMITNGHRSIMIPQHGFVLVWLRGDPFGRAFTFVLPAKSHSVDNIHHSPGEPCLSYPEVEIELPRV